ncbi:MAG: PD-(D/E)XK nuclease family protein [Sporocytophaga sp.]|nr:PD-(D/E)XK nuclease family protein [Sporocytophaga sp.]
MNSNQIEQFYKDILSDPDFDKLSLLIKQPNIFSALKITNYEIRHSNFLSWLLDPNETHGLGDLFLTRILRDLFLDQKSKGVSIVDIPRIDLRKANIYREWNNIDIVVETEKFVIAIENKFESGEHSNQLDKYKKIIHTHFPNHSKVFVFLSAYGITSSDPDSYIDFSYERIVEILEGIMAVYSSTLSTSVKTYIQDYITSIKMNVTNNSEANELARKVYLNHKDLFEFIIQNKPDKASELRKYF